MTCLRCQEKVVPKDAEIGKSEYVPSVETNVLGMSDRAKDVESFLRMMCSIAIGSNPIEF